MPNITCKTELRHVNQFDRNQIEKLLNECDSWKELIEIIPKELESLNTGHDQATNDLLINNNMCLMLDKQKQDGSPSRAFLDYWSTYGIRRPSVEHLVYYASKCRLYRLVDYLVVDLLRSRSIDEYAAKTRELLIDKFKFEREQSRAIELSEKCSNQAIESSEKSGDRAIKRNEKVELTVHGVKRIDLELIKKCTNDFKCKKVGEGGFGVVYLAKVPKDQLEDDLECELDADECYSIAVKVVASDFREQYNTELENLAKYKHPNLLNLIGLACDQTTWCILSEYMINKSLQDCLLATNTQPIDYEQRILIIKQIIDAIHYLHTANETPLIHRDVKSSNILLDRNFNAKLCDFGLARSGLITSKTMNTFNIIGTSVYMSPEAFKGQISVKNDTFSFGVVLLEILTGLPPIDEENEESTDILSYITENVFGELEDECDVNGYERRIVDHLDKRAGDWNLKIAIQLFDLASKATNNSKKKRPTMVQVKELFDEIMRDRTFE